MRLSTDDVPPPAAKADPTRTRPLNPADPMYPDRIQALPPSCCRGIASLRSESDHEPEQRCRDFLPDGPDRRGRRRCRRPACRARTKRGGAILQRGGKRRRNVPPPQRRAAGHRIAIRTRVRQRRQQRRDARLARRPPGPGPARRRRTPEPQLRPSSGRKCGSATGRRPCRRHHGRRSPGSARSPRPIRPTLAAGPRGGLRRPDPPQGELPQEGLLLRLLPAAAGHQRHRHPPGQRRLLPDGPQGGGCTEAPTRATAVRAGPANLCRVSADRLPVRARRS